MSINMILPEICVLVLTAVVLIVDLTVKNKGEKTLGWLTFLGLLVVIVVSLLVALPGETPEVAWGGMLQFDMTGFVFRMIFLSGAALTALYAVGDRQLGERGEFFILLLVSTFGMSLMAY